MTAEGTRPGRSGSTATTRVGPQSHPQRTRSGEHDRAAPLRHRPHQGARARRRPDHAHSGQGSAPPPRLPENDRQRRPTASVRLSAPAGGVRRLAANPRHTRDKRHAWMTTPAPATPRRIVIARTNGDRIRRRLSTTVPNKAVGSCFTAAIQRQRPERICRRATRAQRGPHCVLYSPGRSKASGPSRSVQCESPGE